MGMSPECDWSIWAPFGRATVVAEAGGVGIVRSKGVSAGQVWVVVPLSSTASLCLQVTIGVTGKGLHEIELMLLVNSTSNNRSPRHCPLGRLAVEPPIVSRLVAFRR